MSGRKILIVDDSVFFLKALSMLLQSKGYEVITATECGTAINTVRREMPDLILLDINFPPDVAHGGGVGWDGFRLMNWLHRIDETKAVPIIIITGGDPAKDKDLCRAPGVVGFLRKPVDHAGLLTSIRKALKGKAGEESPPTELPSAKRILFVDDEDDWRYMATMYLTDSGYEVWTARDAAEALRQAERARADLIILDSNLGSESGLVVMKLLKEKHPSMPVLLYTDTEPDQAAVEAMLREGAQQYLRKTTLGEMLKAVQAATGGLPQPNQPKPVAKKRAWERTAEAFERDPETVLLLEDDAAFAESLQLFLESHSFIVTRAADGEEGLRQITATDFDIVLCDMAMPGLPGDRFYQAIERTRPHLCERFVFMTEHPTDPQTEEFIRRVRGVALGKPFPLADLLTAIAIVCKQISATSNRRPLPPSQSPSRTPAQRRSARGSRKCVKQSEAEPDLPGREAGGQSSPRPDWA
jgi:CheY-like chemotaxis protein